MLKKGKSKHYFCYSVPLCKFLEYNKNIKSIEKMNGVHPITKKEFKVFYRNNNLDIALTEWKQVKIQAIEYIKSLSVLKV